MPTFLTVKEAAQLTGKSPSSIRRIIYPILRDDQHPDREQIQPDPKEVLELRLKGENFAWRLSEELLRREIPLEQSPEKSSGTTPKVASEEAGPLLAMLQRELDIKNQQISQQSEQIGKQMELISGLSERLREGNILIGSLQQQLGMPAEKASPTVKVTEVKPRAAKPSAKPKNSKSRPAKKAPVKKRFLARFFR